MQGWKCFQVIAGPDSTPLYTRVGGYPVPLADVLADLERAAA